MKLGANISVTRMAGSASHDFCGTFDGQGYTLTFNCGTAESPSSVDGVAPFSYVSETTPTGGSEVSHPAIRNLNVVANINTSATHASGLVGHMWGTLTIEDCTVSGTIQTSDKYACGYIGDQNGIANITNCVSSVTIKSSVIGDGTHGGFVAAQGSTLTIKGCLFNGKLLSTGTTASDSCGGFVGWSGGTVNISNSLFAPAALGTGETWVGTDDSYTFSRRSGDNITNCYYTQPFGTAQGKQARSITAGENVTIAEGQAFTDGNGNYYDGTLTDSEKAAINSQTLTRLTSLPIAEEPYVWHAFASPMMGYADGTISLIYGADFGGLAPFDLYRYNETTATWENFRAHFDFNNDIFDFTTLDPGRGYIIRQSGATAPSLTSEREQNVHYQNCTVTLSASGPGDLKGFNLIGNPYPHSLPCARPYYSLNPNGTWQAHPTGGTLAIGQAVLVYTTTNNEQIEITPNGIAGNGTKSLPPLPGGFCPGGQSDGDNGFNGANGQFAYLGGEGLVITQPGHLEGYDAIGRRLFSIDLDNFPTTLPTSLFPATGAYVLRLDGQSQKIIIK